MAREPATHDAFFKQLMSELATVERFLAEHLPGAIATTLVPGSLERLDGGFVDADLRRSLTDLLFGVRLRTTDGSDRPAFAVLLFEHKSAPDPHTPLQLLRYELGIWQRWLDDGRGLPLPPVIAVVVHHGPQGWRASPHFQDLFGALPQALLAAVPHFRHELVDLVTIPDEQLSSERRLRVKLLLMKHILANDLDARLERLLTEARALGTVEFGKALVYLDTNRAHVSQARLYAALRAAAAAEGDDAMDIFEFIKEQEILKANAKGKAEGKAEGEAKTLMRLLARRFGPLSPTDQDRITAASLEQLDAWIDRLLDAASLAEVLNT